MCLFAADPLAPKTETDFLFVNGGGSPASNYSTHEEDLKAFFHTLFQGKGTVLNAGGPGTKMLPIGQDGLIEVGEDGLWKEVPSGFKGPVKAARLKEVREAFTRFGKKPVTAVFGDHGSEKGVSLWGDEDLSVREFHELQTKLPESTLFRSVHLHCHSLAALLDPKRKKPRSPAAWPPYLKENYRKNSCGLVTSDADEVSDYQDFGAAWTEGTWNKLLTELPHPSLKSMRDRLVEVKGLKGSIKLTSDALAEDIFEAFCAKGARGFSPAAAKADEHGGSAPESSFRAEAALPNACFSAEERKDIDRLDGEVEKQHELYLQQMGVLDRLGDAYIHSRWPELGRDFEAAQKIIEEPAVQKAMGEPSPKTLEADLLSQAGEKARKVLDKYSLIQAQIAHGGLDPDWFQAESVKPEFREWLEQPALQESFGAVIARMKEPGSKAKGMLEIRDAIMDAYDKARGERKKFYRRRQGTRKSFVKALLENRGDDPDIAPIKEYYESILRCEDSSLR